MLWMRDMMLLIYRVSVFSGSGSLKKPDGFMNRNVILHRRYTPDSCLNRKEIRLSTRTYAIFDNVLIQRLYVYTPRMVCTRFLWNCFWLSVDLKRLGNMMDERGTQDTTWPFNS